MVSLFAGLRVNYDNLPFSYVILFLYSLLCHYMHETCSWHAYSYALGFLWKNRCDTNHRLGKRMGGERGRGEERKTKRAQSPQYKATESQAIFEWIDGSSS
jgi:hypothetical protein